MASQSTYLFIEHLGTHKILKQDIVGSEGLKKV